MLNPLEFAQYVGFTGNEVHELCVNSGTDFDEIKAWYAGYDFPDVGAVYNPYSVMKAIKAGKCDTYWKQTSAPNLLKDYISMDFDGLQEKAVRLTDGETIPVNTDGFKNDFTSFESADDVLTLLIHLGYLKYHKADRTVQIPNEEVRTEFRQLISMGFTNPGWIKLIRRSQKLLDQDCREC